MLSSQSLILEITSSQFLLEIGDMKYLAFTIDALVLQRPGRCDGEIFLASPSNESQCLVSGGLKM